MRKKTASRTISVNGGNADVVYYSCSNTCNPSIDTLVDPSGWFTASVNKENKTISISAPPNTTGTQPKNARVYVKFGSSTCREVYIEVSQPAGSPAPPAPTDISAYGGTVYGANYNLEGNEIMYPVLLTSQYSTSATSDIYMGNGGLQYCTGDTSVEGNWHDFLVSDGSAVTIGGFKFTKFHPIVSCCANSFCEGFKIEVVNNDPQNIVKLDNLYFRAKNRTITTVPIEMVSCIGLGSETVPLAAYWRYEIQQCPIGQRWCGDEAISCDEECYSVERGECTPDEEVYWIHVEGLPDDYTAATLHYGSNTRPISNGTYTLPNTGDIDVYIVDEEEDENEKHIFTPSTARLSWETNNEQRFIAIKKKNAYKYQAYIQGLRDDDTITMIINPIYPNYTTALGEYIGHEEISDLGNGIVFSDSPYLSATYSLDIDVHTDGIGYRIWPNGTLLYYGTLAHYYNGVGIRTAMTFTALYDDNTYTCESMNLELKKMSTDGGTTWTDMTPASTYEVYLGKNKGDKIIIEYEVDSDKYPIINRVGLSSADWVSAYSYDDEDNKHYLVLESMRDSEPDSMINYYAELYLDSFTGWISGAPTGSTCKTIMIHKLKE